MLSKKTADKSQQVWVHLEVCGEKPVVPTRWAWQAFEEKCGAQAAVQLPILWAQPCGFTETDCLEFNEAWNSRSDCGE